MEKIEKAKQLKEDLIILYKEYFLKEKKYLSGEKAKIEDQKRDPEKEVKTLDIDLKEAREELARVEDKSGRNARVADIESRIFKLREKKDQVLREIGKLEGIISFQENTLARSLHKGDSGSKTVYLSEIERLEKETSEIFDKAKNENDSLKIKDFFEKAFLLLKNFVEDRREKDVGDTLANLKQEVASMNLQKESLEKEAEGLATLGENLNAEYRKIQEEIEEKKDSNIELQRKVFSIMTRQNELHATLNLLKSKEDMLRHEEEDFKRELFEAGSIAGREAVNFENLSISTDGILDEERSAQLERRRNIEKIKIRLEEAGISGEGDISKEFKETEERDIFLGREIEDLGKARVTLTSLIEELKNKLDEEFRLGINKINQEFQKYFGLLFGGGEAGLKLVREEKRKKKNEMDDLFGEGSGAAEDYVPEEEAEEGIEIDVNLPRKKVKSLMMLSGGERALTSIALLFAMSQVNPPPFIILDETDAALDEANSKKYGDMIEALSKYSQLILITHNRETMSRAGVIYGVTMGSDGISRLLSIAFDEALAVAK
jgi:chromosome segregation protein